MKKRTIKYLLLITLPFVTSACGITINKVYHNYAGLSKKTVDHATISYVKMKSKESGYGK